MFCTECGVSAESQSKFCSACGTPVAEISLMNEQIVEISIRQYPGTSELGTTVHPTYSPVPKFALTDTYSGMSFTAAVKSVFSKYARFEGRATRSEYWYFALFNMLILAGLFILGIALASASSDAATFAGVLLFIWFLAVIIPSIALTVRRLHDAGYSGWLYLLGLVPYLGGVVLFIFSLLASQQTDNQWGRAPKPFITSGLIR